MSSPKQQQHHHHPSRFSHRLPFCVASGNSFRLSATDVDSDAGGGHRRERRLRQFFWHERLSVAMALSKLKHHTSRGHRKDRAGRTHELYFTATFRKRLPPGFLATLSGRAAEATGPGSAAHHGAGCRFRCTCGADGGTVAEPRAVLRHASKCCLTMFLREQLFAIRSWRNSKWKCRRSFPLPCCSGFWSRT